MSNSHQYDFTRYISALSMLIIWAPSIANTLSMIVIDINKNKKEEASDTITGCFPPHTNIHIVTVDIHTF